MKTSNTFWSVSCKKKKKNHEYMWKKYILNYLLFDRDV